MNKNMIKKMIYHRVHIHPVAKRLQGSTELQEIDDEWIIEQITDKGRGGREKLDRDKSDKAALK